MPLRRFSPSLLLLFGACATGSHGGAERASTRDDAAVYGVALDSLAPAGKPLVVLDSTLAIRRDAPLFDDARIMGADSAMLAEFRARTRASEVVARELR